MSKNRKRLVEEHLAYRLPQLKDREVYVEVGDGGRTFRIDYETLFREVLASTRQDAFEKNFLRKVGDLIKEKGGVEEGIPEGYGLEESHSIRFDIFVKTDPSED